MKMLADFKRDVKSKKIKLEMIERFGKSGNEIPERCRGIRTVCKVNTVGITLETEAGLKSELDFPPAKLIEYDGKTLVIYEKGERDLTEQEKEILKEWQEIEHDYIQENPYSDTFWKRKDYFKKCPCPWLEGAETVKGKRYNYKGKVVDNQIRGAAILKYHVITEKLESR